MSKSDEQFKEFDARLAELEDRCNKAEGAERMLHEELEGVQQQLIRLKRWQDCARELLGGSRSVAVK